jgi:DNA repair protein RecO (recombination protein O)
MFIHHRSPGIVVKKEDRGEADQLLTIYTKDFGKLEILAKSIRKISSKLRSGVEIFYLSEFEFIQGKGYKTLTDAILLEKFANLRDDLSRLKFAYQMADVADDFLRAPESDKEIWNLLLKTLKKINDPKILSEKLPAIYYSFLFNFISLLGYGLSLPDFKKLRSFSKEYLLTTLGMTR